MIGVGGEAAGTNYIRRVVEESDRAHYDTVC